MMVEVSVSQTFYEGIFGFGGQVPILGPEKVKEEYRKQVLCAVDWLKKKRD